jgi:pantetheine-phosphate adenylyltransferase
MRIAVYPGSFDPITNGHIDIAKRALSVFDKVIIGITANSKKQSLFTPEERIDLINHIIEDLKIDSSKIEVCTFEGLTVDFCAKKNASSIIRGLRAVTDFDYEYAISLMNRKLAPNVETIFLMASGENSYVSSSIVKEVARHGRSVSDHVHEFINKALLDKFNQSK